MMHKIKVDVKTSKDIPEELQKRLKELDEISALETTLGYLLSNLKFYKVTQGRFVTDSDLLFAVTISDEMMPLIKKIENECKTLGEICCGDIKEGDTKRQEEETVITHDEYKMLPDAEKSVYFKVIKGESIEKYSVDWEGLYIRSSSPLNKARLLVKDYSKELTVAYDDGQYRCLRTVYCAYPNDPEFDPLYVLGVLNSKLMSFYYLAYFYTSRTSFRAGNFRFRTQFIKRLHIKRVNKKIQEGLESLGKNLIDNKSEYKLLSERVADFPSSYFTGSEKFRELAQMAKAVELKRDSYKLSSKALYGDTIRDLSGLLTYRVRLSEDSYVDFSSELVFRYVLESLKRRNKIIRHELIELKIPSEAFLGRILKQYSNDMARIKELEGIIKQTEAKIDHRVYEIYGLTPDETWEVEKYYEKMTP